MDNEHSTLAQRELLALALEAIRRGDSGRSIAYLKEAATRADATDQVHFLLGSEYAQIDLVDLARLHFEHSLEVNSGFAIARFQLGLLHLTTAKPQEALDVWAPLASLGDEHPLEIFRQGMSHLMKDELADCVRCLERGIAANLENAALNANIQFILERVKAAIADGRGPSQAVGETKSEEPESHLFLNAYTGGKVH
jgi:hypothetical protein